MSCEFLRNRLNRTLNEFINTFLLFKKWEAFEICSILFKAKRERFSKVIGRYLKGGSVLAKVLSSAVIGIDAFLVEVEVDITSGLPTFTTVGLPEASVKESKERVKSAINNSGYRFPDDRITVNLAPANIKKEGTGFDLPIALGILAATQIIPQQIVSKYLVPNTLF